MKSIIQQRLKTAKGLLYFAFVFWIAETVFFQILYGWHWEATETPESICDLIAQLLFWTGVIYMLKAFWRTSKTFSKFLITHYRDSVKN